ncbi:MAG: hypothetical protein OXR62_16360 [Ahrensia sp.]|nr:hypothetical protein [Ahrensia sp.]
MAEASKRIWTVDALAKLASGNRREAGEFRLGASALPLPDAANDPDTELEQQVVDELHEREWDMAAQDFDEDALDDEPVVAPAAQPLSKSTDDALNKFKQLVQQNRKPTAFAREPSPEKTLAGNALLMKAQQEANKLAEISALAKRPAPNAEVPNSDIDETAHRDPASDEHAVETMAGVEATKVTDPDAYEEMASQQLQQFLEEKGEGHLTQQDEVGEAAADETALDIDFFKLRRNMRFLQFQCEVGNSYNQEMRQQFSEALQAFSHINVRYKEMHQRESERLDLTRQLEQARREITEIADAKTRAEAELARTKASMERSRKEYGAAVSELEMDRDTARAETQAVRKDLEAQRRDYVALSEDMSQLEKSAARDKEQAALMEAETSVLRDALTEACDTIAQDMSSRMMHETMLQELEDKVAQLEHEAALAGRGRG